MRINLGYGEGLLQKVQHDIGAILAFEHVPLGSVQKWIQPNGPLFEALFSVSIDDDRSSGIWDVVESKQPQADVSVSNPFIFRIFICLLVISVQYILAVEVVLNRRNGQVRIDCAYTEPLKSDEVISILQDFEATAKSLVEGSYNLIRESQGPSVGVEGIDTVEESGVDEEPNGAIDEELEDKIKIIISQFLKVERDHISNSSQSNIKWIGKSNKRGYLSLNQIQGTTYANKAERWKLS